MAEILQGLRNDLPIVELMMSSRLTITSSSSRHIVDMYKSSTRVLRGDHGRPILAVSVRSCSFIYRFNANDLLSSLFAFRRILQLLSNHQTHRIQQSHPPPVLYYPSLVFAIA